MKGFIFDLDGTMVDNMMVHHKAWQVKLRELGMDLSLDQVREKVHGVNEEIMERLFGDRFSPEERRFHSSDKEKRYRDIFLPELKLVAGLNDFLERAKVKDIPMAIGSAAPHENVEFVLDKLSIGHYFTAFLSASDVENGKPHPEIYLKVAERMGVPIEDCIVFEDSPTGAEASLRAGSQSIIVTTTHSQEEFSEFTNILQFIPDFQNLNITSQVSTS